VSLLRIFSGPPEAEKAGIVGERDGPLERDNHSSTNDFEEIVLWINIC
jgi:hypothetical protein